MSIRSTIARNTGFNIAGRICEAVLGLVLVRYMWMHVTPQEYGLWALVGVFTGYVSLLDFGIGSAYGKFIAEHAARNESDAISGVVTTGLAFYAVFGLGLVAAGWPLVTAGVSWVDSFGMFSALRAGEPAFVFHASLLLFAFSACIGPFSAVQTGLQRMDVSNVLGFFSSVVRLASTYLFLEMGLGLPGLIYASTVTLGLYGGASVAAAFWLWPALRVSPRHLRSQTFGRLFDFGWKTQIAKLANIIMFETDKLVVGVLFGRLEMVAVYELGVNLANKVRQAPVLLFSALMPAAAELDARGRDDRLRELYLRSTKYVAIATLPLLLFAAGSADLLMRVWMGEGFAQAAWVLRIIALGYIANVLPGPGVSIALGKGRPDLQMKAGIISMTANIALTIVLYFAIGFWGIPIATAVSMAVSWLWFLFAVEPVAGVGLRRLFREALVWPAIACIPGLVVCAALDLAMPETSGWVQHFAALTAGLIVHGGLFLLVLRTTPFLDDFDRRFFEGTLRLDRVPGYRWWARSSRHA